MGLTSDRKDPRLTHGADESPVPQAEVYLVLSDEELAKGFVRPVRRSYIHVGPAGPKYPLRDVTPEERDRWSSDYVKFEEYPDDEAGVGKFWTQAQLDMKGCGGHTTMGLALCETYAREPTFYGATYCASCSMHRPVAEFRWAEDGAVVGS